MSTADGWDLTVPEEAAELLAELRRHGVRPGQRLHVAPAPTQVEKDHHHHDAEPDARSRSGPRRLSFAGSVDAEPDLAERTDDYLTGFGQA